MCDLDKSCKAFVATSNVLWSGKLPLAVMFCFVVFFFLFFRPTALLSIPE